MRRVVSLVLIMALAILPTLAGCGVGKKAGKKPIESPYTFDYKTDKKNVKFFTEGDSYETIMSGGPFYAGAQPQPSGRGAEFAKLRAAKVAEIEKEARVLAGRAKAMAPKVAKIRGAYLSFLTEAYKEEPKLKEYTKETFSRISMARTKEAFIAAEYESLDAKTNNAFADSFIGYLKTGKAVALGSLYLEDIHNIVGFSAAAISSLADHPSAKIKAAREKLDKEMDAFDALRGDITAAQSSIGKIDYGQRQLESADYYLAKEGERFMTANMAGLQAKAKELKPRSGLTKSDIKFIRNYVKVMGKMRAQIAAQLKNVDKTRVIPVKVKKRPAASLEFASPAYAADEMPFVSGAADTLRLPMDQGKPQPPISAWDILKVPGKIWRAGKATTGVILDTAGVTVQNITRAGYGIYHGEPAKSIWKDMQQNTKVITENYNKGVSGASTLKTAGEYLEGAENAAGQTAEEGVEGTLGKGWTSWGVGGFTKIVVGTFTGLGKGIYKVSKTDATTADVVGGTVDIGLSFIGGSKTIFNRGVLKTLGKEGILAGKGGLNFIKTLLVSADKAAAKKAMAKLLGNPKMTEAELARLLTYTAEIAAKEAMAKTLAASRESLLKAMKNMLKAGGRKALTEGKNGLKEALEGLLEKSYAANLASIRELLGETVGKDISSFLANVVAGKVDGYISGLITEIMAGAPDPAELNGQWTGSMTITDVVVPPGADAQKPEGCELDFNKLKGQTQPLEWTIQMGEDGKGIINGSSGGGTPMAVSYNGGAISGSGSQKGVTLVLSGEFTRGAESGYGGAGAMNISYGEGIKVIASWHVSK